MKKKKERDNTQSTDERRKGKSLPAKICLKLLKIIFIWVPVSIFSLIIISLVAVKLYFTSGRAENLIISNFNKLSYGSIALNVKDFNPYKGFDIRNIIIRNGDEFNKSKFVEVDRLVLRYDFFSMLIGNIHFKEIGIYKPRIYLKEKNGVWNAARLMKPGAEKAEPEKEEAENMPQTKEINLPVSVELLLNFTLDDLRVYMDGDSFDSSIEGLTYNMNIWIPPVKRIPKSLEAALLLKTMKMELNPKGSMDIYFATKGAGIKTPLILTWKLVFDKSDKSKEFESMFKLGTHNAPVRFRKTFLAPLDFLVSYDIFYNPANDYLKIGHLAVSFKGNKLLNLEGDINKATIKQEINIRMTESKIVLSDLYPYFFSFTGDRATKFGGTISVFPLVITGNPSNMDIDGQLNIKNLYFKNPALETIIPEFKFLYSVKKRNDDMKIAADLDIGRITANMGRDKLGDNGIVMGMAISSYNNFQRVEMNNFTFKVYNPESKRSAFFLALKGEVKLKPDLSGDIEITDFTFRKDNFSDGIRNKYLAAVPLKKPVDLNLSLRFNLGANKTKADLGMHVKVPDYNINDLKLKADVMQDNKAQRIWLNGLNLESRDLGLRIGASGRIDTAVAPFSDSDLGLVVELDSPDMKPVYGPWNLSGNFKFAFNIKGDLKTGKTFGSIKIKNLFVKNDESMLSIEDLNMDFPYEYHFTSGPVESRIAVNKIQLIDVENFKEKENFTIKSIKAKHPARNIEFEYAKDFAAAMFFRNNAFEIAKMKMYVLDGAVYGRDILFYLADMPATGSYKNVEYRLILDVTNVDIGQLDNPDRKAKTREAELSLNANFAGKGLDMFLGKGKDRGKELNIKGYVNINKIGEQFAKRLFEGLSEEKGKSKLGIAQYALDNTMNIKGFNYNLDIGLMDAEVNLTRKAIGYIVLVEDVRFTRMPIQEYLNNIFGRK